MSILFIYFACKCFKPNCSVMFQHLFYLFFISKHAIVSEFSVYCLNYLTILILFRLTNRLKSQNTDFKNGK